MKQLKYNRFVIVKDDFYKRPYDVLAAAKHADFYEPRYYTGFRSRTVYHEPGVKSKLEKILGIKITRWDTDPEEENGVFYLAHANGKHKEVPGVHSDFPYNDITAVVYLTPGLPFNCGTSLWRHKRTGLTDPPTAAFTRKNKLNLKKLVQQFEDESKDRSKWEEIDRIGYRFNRMVAYPSGALHSATNHFGSSLADVRIYQTFRIGVDWKTFRMR